MSIEEQKKRLDQMHKASKQCLKAIEDLDPEDAAQVLGNVGEGFGLIVSLAPTDKKSE